MVEYCSRTDFGNPSQNPDLSLTMASQPQSERMELNNLCLAVHGGAGRLSSARLEGRGRLPFERALKTALRAGQQVLLDNGSAVDAVIAAVRCLEDDPALNAGRGAVLCADGTIELSASVMCGRTLNAGAVTGVSRVRNPVQAASAVLTHHHSLISGLQAERFAADSGAELVDPGYFETADRRQQWEQRKHETTPSMDHSDDGSSQGTVGAVARDFQGNLAAATSTGGMVNQLAGRVGDTPVVGAGTWADNRTCALSATGNGDVFLRHGFARRVADLIELSGLQASDAADRALEEARRLDGLGGCIVVDDQGRICMPFSTPHMLRGTIRGNGEPVFRVFPDGPLR